MDGQAQADALWSVVQRKVAKDWMKNSSPPVARSWLTGGLEDGRDDQEVHDDAQDRAEADATSPATHSGQP